MENVASIAFEPGFLITKDANGKGIMKYPIATGLRVEDIPVGLTYTQVQAITSLANLVAVLIRTLIDKQVLNTSFLENDDYSLDAVIQSIERMGGDYGEPDISVG